MKYKKPFPIIRVICPVLMLSLFSYCKKQENTDDARIESKKTVEDISLLDKDQLFASLPEYPSPEYKLAPVAKSELFSENVRIKVFEENEPLLKPYEPLLRSLTGENREKMRTILWKKMNLALAAQEKHKELKDNPEALREWRRRWNKTAQVELDALYREELKLSRYRHARITKVKEEEEAEFLERLNSDNATFEDKDIKVVRHLLMKSRSKGEFLNEIDKKRLIALLRSFTRR